MTTKPKYMFGTLFYEATRLCNFSCHMCMASSDNSKIVKESVKKQLTTDEIEEHILKTAKDIGIHTITWSGGEFILRKDAIEIIRRAARYGYNSTVCTNGEKVTPELLMELHEASGGTLVVALGINSLTPENAETRDADSELALSVLDMCKELGIRRHVVVTVGQHNADNVGDTLQWLEDNMIPYNRSPFTARGSGRKEWESMRILKEDMEAKIHPALMQHPIGYISYTPFFLSPEVHDNFSKGEKNVTVPQNPPIGCWCGTWLGITAEGDISPCGILMDEVSCGNVKDKPLEQLIDESPIMQSLLDRNQLKGKCGRCRYKFTCGGCRAMAYFEHGDILEEDPTCFFEPEDENTVCEREELTNKMFKRYVFMIRQAERQRTRNSSDSR